ncbi:hypothetical protein [Dinoroseobacter sp. S375]|uniref:hypothetical protein n=1 Tax=Dinoroseobacter sp. S375 TaxID=3415136 RepID=UPI003C7A1658
MRTAFMSLALAVLAGVAQASTVTLSEETFAPGEVTPVRLSGPVNGQIASQAAGDGNPAPSLTVSTTTNIETLNAFMVDGLTYDLSMGGLQSLSYSVDYDPFQAFGQGQAYGIVVEQNGSYFASAAGVTFATPGWQTGGQQGLVAVNFSRLLGDGTLDFSQGAAQLSFGLYSGNSGGNGVSVRYDNLEVVLAKDMAAIPLPASLPLLLLGLGGLALRARRG